MTDFYLDKDSAAADYFSFFVELRILLSAYALDC